MMTRSKENKNPTWHEGNDNNDNNEDTRRKIRICIKMIIRTNMITTIMVITMVMMKIRTMAIIIQWPSAQPATVPD